MKKCRKLVELFSSSTQKMEKLLNVQKSMDRYNGKIPVKVIVDVVTRWWSTYSMLDRLVYLRPALNALIADNTIPEDNVITQEEWHTVLKIVDILKPFKTAQKKLEGDKYVTISWIPYMIKNIHSKLGDALHLASDEDDEDQNLVSLLNKLLSDFRTRWMPENTLQFSENVLRGHNCRQVGIHPLISIATALDPRFKSLSVYDDDDSKDKVWQQVLALMVNEAESRPEFENIHNEINVSTIDNNNSIDSDIEDIIDEIERNNQFSHNVNMYRRDENSNTGHVHDMCTSELESYKKIVPLSFLHTDAFGNKHLSCPLEHFWVKKKDQFPILFQLAMKYLCIPATSAPSERIFSVASKIISKFRNRISDGNAGSILFIHGNLEWYLDSSKSSM